MIEDNVFCKEADASCVSAELKKMGFTVIPKEVTVDDRKAIDKILQIKNVAKFHISNGPWGTLMRSSGKIRVEKGLNFYSQNPS
ncbi:MAG: hypothetical protein Q8N37_01670 [bacterium]|nr:hypothetical protein [bacterium]